MKHTFTTRFLNFSCVFLLGFLATSSLCIAQILENEPLDRIVAVVEDDVILQSELDRAVNNILQQYATQANHLPPRDILEQQVLERLILIRVQIQRAASTGILITDTELDQNLQQMAMQNSATVEQMRLSVKQAGLSWKEFRKNMRDELMAQRLQQRFVQSRVNVTDTEIEILLASGGLKQGEIRISHILIPVADNAKPEQIEMARGKAEQVRKEIDQGLDFTSAAIRYSAGQQALDGGDLGWRRHDEVPEIFSDLIQTLQVGEVTQPMRGPSGFHILKLVDQRDKAIDLVKEYHAQHIMIKPSEVTSDESAQATIQDLYRQLTEEKADFNKLAKAFSEDVTTANQGGDMGWFEINDYGTKVAQVIEKLKENEVSAPFQTEAAWHIIQLLGSREQDRTEEKTRELARKIIHNRKAEAEWETFLRQIHNEAYIENRLTKKTTKTG